MLNGEKGISFHDTDDLGYVNLIDACEHAGVARFVYSSVADLDPAPRPRLSLPEMLREPNGPSSLEAPPERREGSAKNKVVDPLARYVL